MAVTARTITQQIAAGNDFDGTEPASSSRILGPPSEPKLSVVEYKDLPAGGLFDFKSKGRPQKLHRLLLDAGDATSWVLSLRVTSPDGSTIDYAILTSAEVGSNVVAVFNEDVLLEEGDTLVLVTVGATSALYASITLSPW